MQRHDKRTNRQGSRRMSGRAKRHWQRLVRSLWAATLLSGSLSTFAQLNLPYNGSAISSATLFQITQNGTGNGAAFYLNNSSASGYALFVQTTAPGPTIYGKSLATSGFTYGARFEATGSQARGVLGYAQSTTGASYGVYGLSDSVAGTGVFGWARATTGTTYGVYGRSNSPSGYGGYFAGRGYFSGNVAIGATGTESARLNVIADSTVDNVTLRLHELGDDGPRIEFTNSVNTARKWHIWGYIGAAAANDRLNLWNSQTGSILTLSGSGQVGIGTFDPQYTLHVRTGTGDRAIFGHHTATSGTNYGVYGQSASTNGKGVYGIATATSGETYGVFGRSDSRSGGGVFGVANATSGVNWGVLGLSYSPDGWGIYCEGAFGASGTKLFQIDHPLHPETHYLNHFCTEGPEPYNAYSGVVVLDAKGEAWVQLPDYFEAINRDPRYTLTPIGAPMPNLHVSVEIQGNRFKIAGGVPGKKVSWEVKAVRNDRWVQRYGYQTEQEKPEEHRGKYLHPELYGQPKELGIHYYPELERPNEVERPK